VIPERIIFVSRGVTVIGTSALEGHSVSIWRGASESQKQYAYPKRRYANEITERCHRGLS